MFVEQDVNELARAGHEHVFQTTAAYWEGRIQHAALEDIAARLAACAVGAPGRTCILFGYGSHPRSSYRMLRQNADTEVLWCMPMLPLCAWPLSLIAAAQGGLVVVKTAEALEQALIKLADLAMVELYSFSDALLSSVQDHVVRYRWRSRVGRVIGGDPGYFCFGMDGDWEEPPAWYSYGRACPVEIQDALKGY